MSAMFILKPGSISSPCNNSVNGFIITSPLLRYTVVILFLGFTIQAKRQPLSIHSLIFSSMYERASEGDIISITKSGQMCVNF